MCAHVRMCVKVRQGVWKCCRRHTSNPESDQLEVFSNVSDWRGRCPCLERITRSRDQQSVRSRRIKPIHLTVLYGQKSCRVLHSHSSYHALCSCDRSLPDNCFPTGDMCNRSHFPVTQHGMVCTHQNTLLANTRLRMFRHAGLDSSIWKRQTPVGAHALNLHHSRLMKNALAW